MKTAVEWLEEKLIDIFNFKKGECYEIEQAKKIEKQQMIEMHNKGFDSVKQLNDDYAISFAKWIIINCNHKKMEYLDLKELLEMFKREKGL
jgi:hypothetical protein